VLVDIATPAARAKWMFMPASGVARRQRADDMYFVQVRLRTSMVAAKKGFGGFQHNGKPLRDTDRENLPFLVILVSAQRSTSVG
jgi:hypothetical protein